MHIWDRLEKRRCPEQMHVIDAKKKKKKNRRNKGMMLTNPLSSSTTSIKMETERSKK